MSTSLKKTQVVPRDLKNYIRLGKMNEVKMIIEKFGLNYDKSWYGGYTLLLHALKHKQRTVAEYLLSQDPKLLDDKKQSFLLHAAVQCKFKTIVEGLLDHGANVQEQDSTFRTPLQIALDSNCFVIAELIIKKRGIVKLPASGSANSLLHRAAPRSLVIVKMLLKEKSKNLNVDCFEDGYTPLHRAILNDNVPVVKCLLENNADMHLRSSLPLYRQYTALHFAVYRCNAEIVSLLLQNGARINVKNYQNKTPFFMAFDPWNGESKKCYDVLEAFANHGIDLDLPVGENRPPLYWALNWNIESHVKLFLKYGANVDILDDHGSTLLHHFAKCFNKNAVQLLLRYGADTCSIFDKLIFDEEFRSYGRTDYSARLKLIDMITTIAIKDLTFFFFEQFTLEKLFGKDLHVNRNSEWIDKLTPILVQLTERYVCGNLTFFSLLRRTPQEISGYLENPKFIAATKDVDFVEEFPYYGGFIVKNLGAAFLRKKLLEKGRERGIYTIFPVPCEISDQIFLYLNNQEFKNLVSAVSSKK